MVKSALGTTKAFLSNRCLTSFVVNQLKLTDEVASVIARRLHRHHTSGLLTCHVLNNSFVDLRLNVALQYGV